jgi:hypothetical protein
MALWGSGVRIPSAPPSSVLRWIFLGSPNKGDLGPILTDFLTGMLSVGRGDDVRNQKVRERIGAVKQLRMVLAEMQIATVPNQVLLSMFNDFENFSVLKPVPRHKKSVNEMFDQVIEWGEALKPLRTKAA